MNDQPHGARRSSDWTIERFLVGELGPAERRELEDETERNPELAQLIAERQAENQAFITDARRRSFAGLVQQAGTHRRQLRQPRVFGWPALAAACVCVLSAVVVWNASGPEVGGLPHIRARGSLSLTAAVLHGGEARVFAPGETLWPGDRIRLTLDDPQGGYVAVVLQEASGHASLVYAPEELGRLTGGSHTLPDSLELDAARGTERLFVILSADEPRTAVWLGEIEDAFRVQGIHHDWRPSGIHRVAFVEWLKPQ
jgi:hypothetical protein